MTALFGSTSTPGGAGPVSRVIENKPRNEDMPVELRRVWAELLRLFYGTLPIVLAANLINGSLIAIFFAGRASPLLLGGWFALTVVSVVARMGSWFWYQRAATPLAKRADGGRIFAVLGLIGSAVSGALWGAAGALFYHPTDNSAQIVLAFVLGGMGAGALTSLTPCIRAFYLYLLLSVFPFTVRLATSGAADHEVMAAMCVVYTVSLILLGRKVHGWLVLSLQMKFANTDLVRELEVRVERRTRELRDANAKLSQDIAKREQAQATLSDYGDRQAAVAIFGQRALSGLPMETLFEEAVRLVVRRLHIAGATILQWHAGSGRFVACAHAGSAAGSTAGLPSAEDDHSVASHVLFSGMPIVSDDVARDARFVLPPALQEAGVQSIAGVMITCAGQPFGVLEAFDVRTGTFTGDGVSFMQTIANMLAASIERKKAESDIQRLALVDSLTGLPNRARFRERLLRESANVAGSDRLLALMLLDLDHFKDVNDTLGHPVGDRLLTSVAGRLRACVREGEPPARLGGDEFAIVLAGQRDREAVASVAGKIINAISEPFSIDGHEIRLGASIGITLCPVDGKDPDNLLRNADLALYRAKAQGRNTYEFYAVDMTSHVEERKALERDLRVALAENRLGLLYQPQFDLRDNRMTAVEALVRWPHPTRGPLLPDAFVPMAETTGLVVPLGIWVLEQVLRQSTAWGRDGLPMIMVAVNLSPTQCRRCDLVSSVERIAEQNHFDLNLLELEVTEQIFLPQESLSCVEGLAELQLRGVTVSLDDFGTGYSSMGRLHGLPVDKVKIDKCFVGGIGRTRDSEMIVRAMIALGRSLGLEVVAEGVETEEQLDFLRTEGCHGAQGFLLARPLPAEDVATLLRRATLLHPGVHAGGS